MLGLYVLLAGCIVGSLSLPANSSLNTRIIGGSATKIGSVPYIASIQKYGKHICGGAILNKRTVITAAHCLEDLNPSSLRVRVGSESVARGGTLVPVDDIYQHTRYESDGLDYDVGLLRLSRDLKFNSNVEKVDLPSSGESLADGTYGLIAGWGVTDRDSSNGASTLYSAMVPVINQSTCNRLIGSLTEVGHLTQRMFCAGFLKGGVDSCRLDAGGPMVSYGTLIGIISWGDGCAERNKPGVYVRVSSVTPWIKNTLWRKYQDVL